ncbi:hypothetical protein ABZ916_10705 [Streptomyces sp. NPDC046853]|uniref:hypothetical protein n=1 Tax=Streptomyces sp. NPDC046853 TaxID=3154920 RepID=UPI0033EBC11A
MGLIAGGREWSRWLASDGREADCPVTVPCETFALSRARLLKEPVMTLGTVPGLVLGDASRTSTREPHHLF